VRDGGDGVCCEATDPQTVVLGDVDGGGAAGGFAALARQLHLGFAAVPAREVGAPSWEAAAASIAALEGQAEGLQAGVGWEDLAEGVDEDLPQRLVVIDRDGGPDRRGSHAEDAIDAVLVFGAVLVHAGLEQVGEVDGLGWGLLEALSI